MTELAMTQSQQDGEQRRSKVKRNAILLALTAFGIYLGYVVYLFGWMNGG